MNGYKQTKTTKIKQKEGNRLIKVRKKQQLWEERNKLNRKTES